jgi:DNA-binding CsgD family transcriptional regulator
MVRLADVPYRRIRECFPAYAGRRPVSDHPAAVPALPSGRASQLAAALSVLELGDCERELLVRATATGSAATIPSQGAEWDAKELAEAVDALAHDGFLRSGPDGGLAAADDLVTPTVERACREAAHASAALRNRTTAMHASILSRCSVPLQRLGGPDDLEGTFRELILPHRLVLSMFPTYLPRSTDVAELQDAALGQTRQHAGWKTERDVIASRRLRLPVELAFFRAQAATAGSSIAVAADVPMRLTLLDDRRAVVPIDPFDHEMGAWVIDEPEAVAVVGLQLAQVQAEATAWQPPSPLVLSRREAEVVRLLAAGLTDEGIARRLHITDRTVRRIVAELMAKLGVDSRFALAVECARHALV